MTIRTCKDCEQLACVCSKVVALTRPDGAVLCLTCGKSSWLAGVYTQSEHKPLYHVNVYPYRQTCHECAAVIVEPQSSAWCELFPKKTAP